LKNKNYYNLVYRHMSIRGIIFDGIHYLIGMIIVVILVYSVIQLHNHFSKDNVSIPVPKSSSMSGSSTTATSGSSVFSSNNFLRR
jgi:hypothetical protein